MSEQLVLLHIPLQLIMRLWQPKPWAWDLVLFYPNYSTQERHPNCGMKYLPPNTEFESFIFKLSKVRSLCPAGLVKVAHRDLELWLIRHMWITEPDKPSWMWISLFLVYSLFFSQVQCVLEFGEGKLMFCKEIRGSGLHNHCNLSSVQFVSVQMNDCWMTLELPVLK